MYIWGYILGLYRDNGMSAHPADSVRIEFTISCCIMPGPLIYKKSSVRGSTKSKLESLMR